MSDWPGPVEGERPTGYVVILHDTTVTKQCRWDDAIVAQSMLLAAVERGLGGCMIGSLDHDTLRGVLEIPAQYEIPLVLALGCPAETIVLEHGTGPEAAPYWRDEQDAHHVPKRSTEDILLRG